MGDPVSIVVSMVIHDDWMILGVSRYPPRISELLINLKIRAVSPAQQRGKK
jgi:hypothetical protein